MSMTLRRIDGAHPVDVDLMTQVFEHSECFGVTFIGDLFHAGECVVDEFSDLLNENSNS